MIVKKDYAGEYIVTLSNGKKFAVSKDGGSEYLWNVREWDSERNCPEYCKAPYGCYQTKKEALKQIQC